MFTFNLLRWHFLINLINNLINLINMWRCKYGNRNANRLILVGGSLEADQSRCWWPLEGMQHCSTTALHCNTTPTGGAAMCATALHCTTTPRGGAALQHCTAPIPLLSLPVSDFHSVGVSGPSILHWALLYTWWKIWLELSTHSTRPKWSPKSYNALLSLLEISKGESGKCW